MDQMMPDDPQINMVTAVNPLLIVVVTIDGAGEIDVMMDGLMPEILRPGCLRAMAADLEGAVPEAPGYGTAHQN